MSTVGEPQYLAKHRYLIFAHDHYYPSGGGWNMTYALNRLMTLMTLLLKR